MGLYGYRAKLLFFLGNTPPGYYTSPGYDFSNPGYPPGWSLVTLSFYLWRGAVDDHWVKLLVPCYLTAAAWLAAVWLAKPGGALVGAPTPGAADAQPAGAGLVLVALQRSSAPAAGAGGIRLSRGRGGWEGWGRAVALTAVPALGWRVITAMAGVHDPDFDFSRP